MLRRRDLLPPQDSIAVWALVLFVIGLCFGASDIHFWAIVFWFLCLIVLYLAIAIDMDETKARRRNRYLP